MSLKSTPTGPVPEETARVAEAAFPNGNPYLTLRKKLGTAFANEGFANEGFANEGFANEGFANEGFANLYPDCGQPMAYAPWRLALTCASSVPQRSR